MEEKISKGQSMDRINSSFNSDRAIFFFAEAYLLRSLFVYS